MTGFYMKCKTKMTGFYMKCKTRLKWENQLNRFLHFTKNEVFQKKEETPTLVFSCEYCKIFKNTRKGKPEEGNFQLTFFLSMFIIFYHYDNTVSNYIFRFICFFLCIITPVTQFTVNLVC